MMLSARCRRVAIAWGILCAFMWPLGCDDTPLSTGGPTGSSRLEPVGEITGIDHPEVQLPPESRGIKRLTVDQLKYSLGILGGPALDGTGLKWTIQYQGQVRNALDDNLLGFTLGKPDYVQLTEEIAEPSALYLKFMDDMARHVCDEMMKVDEGVPQIQRTLTRFVEDVEDVQDTAAIHENLRYLALRFLAERISADEPDDARLSDLETLFHAGSQAVGSEPSGSMGWMTVCVGMLTSPEFHLY